VQILRLAQFKVNISYLKYRSKKLKKYIIFLNAPEIFLVGMKAQRAAVERIAYCWAMTKAAGGTPSRKIIV